MAHLWHTHGIEERYSGLDSSAKILYAQRIERMSLLRRITMYRNIYQMFLITILFISASLVPSSTQAQTNHDSGIMGTNGQEIRFQVESATGMTFSWIKVTGKIHTGAYGIFERWPGRVYSIQTTNYWFKEGVLIEFSLDGIGYRTCTVSVPKFMWTDTFKVTHNVERNSCEIR